MLSFGLEANLFEIDLKSDKEISRVRIRNRVDCCWDRIVGCSLEIKNNAGSVVYTSEEIKFRKSIYDFFMDPTKQKLVKDYNIPDIVDGGYTNVKRGLYDAENLGGCYNYCRYVGNPPWFSCMLVDRNGSTKASNIYSPSGRYTEKGLEDKECKSEWP